MKVWWKWAARALMAILVTGGLGLSAAGWRLSRLDPSDTAQVAAQWQTEFASMWPVLLPADEAKPAGRVASAPALLRWQGEPQWRLWPRPQLRFQQVVWPVDGQVAKPGEVLIDSLSLGLDWSLLWSATPRLHHVRAEGLSWQQTNVQAGLQSDWQVQQLHLGSPDAQGARVLDAVLTVALRASPPSSVAKAPRAAGAMDLLKGDGRLRAKWFPVRGSLAPEWRDLTLNFKGQALGQPVQDAELRVARWAHHPQQQHLVWDDLRLRARLGAQGGLGQIELLSPHLEVSSGAATGVATTGQWSAQQPWPVVWQLDSGLPKGRYGAIHWPQWRVLLAGQQGTLAAGQIQADLFWAGWAEGWRWDALAGQLSVQAQSQPERQWSLRGQAQWSPHAAQWQLEGQAHGGVSNALAWDGPFSTQGEWQRWPTPQAKAQLRLATLLVHPDQRTPSSGVPAASLSDDGWANSGLAGLLRWPGRLDLRVGYFGLGDWRMSHVSTQLLSDGQQLTVPQFAARLWDGTLQAKGGWSAADGRWTAQADLSQAQLQFVRPDQAAGRWQATAQGHGQGWALRNISGQWTADVAAGHWTGVDLRAALADRSGEWRPASQQERTQWRRLRASGTLANGQVMALLQLQAAGWQARAQGHLALDNQALDLNWTTPAHPGTLQMQGPWATPRTRIH